MEYKGQRSLIPTEWDIVQKPTVENFLVSAREFFGRIVSQDPSNDRGEPAVYYE